MHKKQKAFIRELTSLEAAMQRVLDYWDDGACMDLYPFRNSFEDTLADVRDWRENIEGNPTGRAE